MIILGIDPGTATTGYGVIAFRSGRSSRVLDYGPIRTASSTPLPARLNTIHTEISRLIGLHRPDVVAVEALFFSRNASSALAVGQARGVGLLAAAQAGLPVFEYTPQQVKQAVTGQGNAAKEQVGYMVKLLLTLTEIPTPDDVADALAVALCHAHHHEGHVRRQRAMGDVTGLGEGP